MGRLKKVQQQILRIPLRTYILIVTLLFCIVTVWVLAINPAVRQASFQDYIQNSDPIIGSRQINSKGQIYYDYQNTHTYITSGDSNNISPNSYRNRVVWLQEAGGQNQIILYDLKTKITQQLSYVRTNTSPAVGAQLVAWQGLGADSWGIYVYDGLHVKKISPEQTSIRPSVSDEQVLYTIQIDSKTDRWKTVIYDTKTNVTKDIVEGSSAEAAWPRFEGDQIKASLEGSGPFYN